ncbi:MAG: ankyrin repeat domain-containing protein, partial [Gammaproteobacteria bacterium]
IKTNLEDQTELLHKPIDIKNNRTALHIAAQHNQIDVVIFLLEKGASIQVKDDDDCTPLLIAALFGKTETLICLLKYGALITEKDDEENTPLLLAAMGGFIETIETILTNGALITEKNIGGNTALLEAAYHGQTEAVSFLLKKGAAITEKDNHGTTILHAASYNNHAETVQWILNHYAKELILTKDTYKTTPLGAAYHSKNPTILANFFYYLWPILSNDEINKIKQFSHPVITECLLFRDYLLPNLINNAFDPLHQKNIIFQQKKLNWPNFVLLFHLIRRYPKIEKLELLNCIFPRQATELPNELKLLVKNESLDRPFTLVIQNSNLDDEILTTLNSQLVLLKGLKELDLSQNKLDDISIQNFAGWGIDAFPTLEQLNISHNQLTYTGIKEFLKTCKDRNHSLTKFIVEYNWLYIQSSITQSISALTNLIHNTKITFFDISANYLVQSTKDDIKNNYNVICCKSASELQPQPSLLGAANVHISYEKWAVYLLRKTNKEHTKFVIEGMYKFGQHFLQAWDFVFDTNDPKRGVVESEFYDPERLIQEISEYNYKCYPIARVTGKKLITIANTDKVKDLFYDKSGVPSSFKGRVFNCYSWAINKLVEAGIESRNNEPVFVAWPTWSLRGQQVCR